MRFAFTTIAVLTVALTGRAQHIISARYLNNATLPAISQINPTTGFGSPLAFVNDYIFLNSMTSANGSVYTIGKPSTGPSPSPSVLLNVNPVTGAVTPGPIITAIGSEGAGSMAFHPTQGLIVETSNDDLWRVDPANGNAVFLGRVSLPGQPVGIQGLAFHPNGTLYGWGVDRYGLCTINLTTLTTTDVSTIGGLGPVQALEFAPNGTLYAAREALFTVNITTGVLTQVGSGTGVDDVRGIAFVPEPAFLGVLTLGLVILRKRI